MCRILASLARRLIPKNRFGDGLLCLLLFFRYQKRFPRRRQLLNDYLFWNMVGKEALDPLRAFVSDKEFVKLYVAGKVGSVYNVPTISVYKDLKSIDLERIPARCCIKPTHLSGEVILRQNGESIDYDRIQRWFGENYYDSAREVNYRYLRPKLIVEPLIFDTTVNEDLKFFCYKGQARLIQIDFNRHKCHTRLYLDRHWNRLEFSMNKPITDEQFSIPPNHEDLIGLADQLSEDFEFIRVDLYTNGHSIFVGELTNWPEKIIL